MPTFSQTIIGVSKQWLPVAAAQYIHARKWGVYEIRCLKNPHLPFLNIILFFLPKCKFLGDESGQSDVQIKSTFTFQLPISKLLWNARYRGRYVL